MAKLTGPRPEQLSFSPAAESLLDFPQKLLLRLLRRDLFWQVVSPLKTCLPFTLARLKARLHCLVLGPV